MNGQKAMGFKMKRQQERIALRGRIVGMRECGRSLREIATNLGISKTTVRLWLQRWEESGDFSDLPKGRRARKTTPEEDRQILETAGNNPFTNAVSIRETLQLDVTPRTVRRRLHEGGLYHRTPAKKQHLTERHRKMRPRFAEQHVQDDLECWGRAISSDEKTFLSTPHGKLHCWRRNNTREDQCDKMMSSKETPEDHLISHSTDEESVYVKEVKQEDGNCSESIIYKTDYCPESARISYEMSIKTEIEDIVIVKEEF